MATCMLVFFACMTCIPLDGIHPNPPLYAPIGIGMVIVLIAQIFGHITGCHISPAVTLAGIIWGNTSISLGIAYVIAQSVGAILGYGILMVLSPIDLIPGGVCVTQPHVQHSVIQSLLFEIIFTGALVLVVCSMWDPVNEHKTEANSLKFGLAIGGLIIVGGPLSGGSMNPVRSLGPAIWTGKWTSHWIYWIGPLIGGVLASTLYKYVWIKVEKVEEHKMHPLAANEEDCEC